MERCLIPPPPLASFLTGCLIWLSPSLHFHELLTPILPPVVGGAPIYALPSKVPKRLAALGVGLGPPSRTLPLPGRQRGSQ